MTTRLERSSYPGGKGKDASLERKTSGYKQERTRGSYNDYLLCSGKQCEVARLLDIRLVEREDVFAPGPHRELAPTLQLQA